MKNAQTTRTFRKSSSGFVIEGGSHFLTWENADAVSGIIRQLMEEK